MSNPQQPQKFSVAAAILAGGSSRRMGRDKGLLEIDGAPLIQHIAHQLTSHFDEVLISAAAPGTYDFLQLPTVVDSVPDQGPLFALVELLAAARHNRLLVVPCDVPELPMEFIATLVTACAPCLDAVVPVNHEGVFEPLLAVYARSFLDVARPAVDDGERTLPRLFHRCRMLTPSLPPGVTIRNLNTPEQYQEYVRSRQ
jgi:molybdopterin-guanine dinucleotide biosynthesis protein A